jgi:hypothetical protein
MKPIELAYLTKGLGSLSRLFDKENGEKEKQLKKLIVERALEIFDKKTDRFDPYSMSSLIKYLSSDRGALDKDTMRLCSYFGKQLIQTVNER